MSLFFTRNDVILMTSSLLSPPFSAGNNMGRSPRKFLVLCICRLHQPAACETHSVCRLICSLQRIFAKIAYFPAPNFSQVGEAVPIHEEDIKLSAETISTLHDKTLASMVQLDEETLSNMVMIPVTEADIQEAEFVLPDLKHDVSQELAATDLK